MIRKIGRLCLVAFLAVPFFSAAPATKPAPSLIRISGERRIEFNDDWRFYRGVAEGAENLSFDDSQWVTLRLPHDWAIEGPFDPKSAASPSCSTARCPTRRSG